MNAYQDLNAARQPYQRDDRPPTANDVQVGGDHYSKYGKLQHWDVVYLLKLDYFQGNISKYVFRHKDKNGIQDLEKARHYLDKYIELLKQEKANGPKDLPAAL